MNEEIVTYLSPWVSGAAEGIVFGGRIHQSVILNFVEERPYVDFVTNFHMNHFAMDDAGMAFSRTGIEEAEPTTARSIVVSHHAHTINEVKACL